MLRNEGEFLEESAGSKQIVEMKSMKPYSTKDEYIYAMKEDLAEWFNSMYSTLITANNFIEQLKNGVLICKHANNVMREGAARQFAFNLADLNAAGIVNSASLIKTSNSLSNISTATRLFTTPSGKTAFAGEYLLYNPAPKAQMYRAYDNITNFIKWCRHIVKVRECLMFETEDLILCKNEKNFILCLLEVARFGSKFGITVPTIIQLEQEIEAEIAMESEKASVTPLPIVEDHEPICMVATAVEPQEVEKKEMSDEVSNESQQYLSKSNSNSNWSHTSSSVEQNEFSHEENIKIGNSLSQLNILLEKKTNRFYIYQLRWVKNL